MTEIMGLMSRKEAAKALNVSVDTLDRYVQDGDLVYVNVGRGKYRERRNFDPADIEEFIRQRKRRKPTYQSTRSRTQNSGATMPGSRGANILSLRDAQIAEARRLLSERLKRRREKLCP
jgi:excisionase family DNA binding protein